MTDATWTTFRCIADALESDAAEDIVMERNSAHLFVFVRVFPADLARLDRYLTHAGLTRIAGDRVVRIDGTPLGFVCAVEVLT